MTNIYILLVGLGLIIFWLIASYNRLITFAVRVKEAWSDIDVQLKRRYDLIPNLVETVKGYARHESTAFEKVTQARAAAIGATNVKAHAQAEEILTGTLKSLFAIAEAYPDLKANQNFLELQRELTDTENKIQAARRFYNTNVRDLNIATEAFPSNLVASLFSFAKSEFFELEGEAEVAKQPVRTNF